jgi:uncharacterized protein (DUF488 family)
VLTVYTIGHSSHPIEHFIALLRQHEIEVLVDTRSSPYSRYAPWFDRELLQRSVTAGQMQYLFMGDVVGGRPKDETFYDEEGRVLYSRVGQSEEFLKGVERLEGGIRQYRVALMCSEEDPAHCHRRLLIGRVLVERGTEILHIRKDGKLQTESDIVLESDKMLTDVQPALFAELDEEKWRSTASVSRKKAPVNSLD